MSPAQTAPAVQQAPRDERRCALAPRLEQVRLALPELLTEAARAGQHLRDGLRKRARRRLPLRGQVADRASARPACPRGAPATGVVTTPGDSR